MKRPSFQFYPGDWMKDPALSMCSTSTRGVWIDLLCAMHEAGETGEIAGSYTQLARCCRCTEDEIKAAIEELNSTKAADVTLGHKNVTAFSENVTVVCRRMKEAHKIRNQNAERKRRQRVNNECHADVTPSRARLSSSSSSTSVIKDTPPPLIEPEKQEAKPAPAPTPKSAPPPVKPEPPIPASLDTERFRAAWADWQQHRREIKNRMTPLAASRQLKELEGWGEARAVAAIEHSIKHGWKGVFENKDALPASNTNGNGSSHGNRNGAAPPAMRKGGMIIPGGDVIYPVEGSQLWRRGQFYYPPPDLTGDDPIPEPEGSTEWWNWVHRREATVTPAEAKLFFEGIR